MKVVYLILAILGMALPYSVFIPWLLENGLNFSALIEQAASTSMGMFAWLDVIVAAIVLIIFILLEGRRQNIKNLWLPLLGTCTVGVSFGLPLFLLMREIEFEKQAT